MAKIISIIQIKGGAGRSTLATSLAAILSTKVKTALIDCDMPQGTSASWFAIRQTEKPTDKLKLHTARDHKELINLVSQIQDQFQCIIIDTPPRIAEIARVALMVSDLNLVPVGASVAEIWATSDLLKTIDKAKERKPNIDVRVVWTRFRGYTTSAQELSKTVKNELDLPELKTRLGYRVAYSDAMGRGLAVHEWSDKNARQELLSLGNEVTKILRS